MLMMRPNFCWRIWAEAWRVQLNVPFKWTATTASQSSSLRLKIIRSRRIPALLTRISTRPNSLIAVLMMFSAAAKSATLSALATARPPLAAMAATTSSAGVVDWPVPSTAPPRSFTTTAAPSSASSSAMPRPMPRPAPVTTATLPLSRLPMVILSVARKGDPAPMLLPRRRRVDQTFGQRQRHEFVQFIEGPPSVGFVYGLHGTWQRQERHRAARAEEELAIDV